MENKEIKIAQLKRAEQGDVLRSDDDLEKSLQYQTKQEAFKKSYKDFYTDIKLSSKEDW
jgi:hypothetical protein